MADITTHGDLFVHNLSCVDISCSTVHLTADATIGGGLTVGGALNLNVLDASEVSVGAVYYGNPTTTGTWRMIQVGGSLLTQSFDGTKWVTKHTLKA